MEKIGTMATYPPRRECLKEVLPRISPQLDRLYVYCNQYTQNDLIELGKWVEENLDGDIRLIDPEYADQNVKDMGKFWPLGTVSGYVFLLDDDLAYPTNYVERHLKAIISHRQVSAVHGRVVEKRPLRNYFHDTISYHYRQPLSSPMKVDIAGTGTTAFSTTHLPMTLFADARTMTIYRGMADIWFACMMKLYDISIYCLPRKSGWLKDAAPAKGIDSIYQQTKDDTWLQCNVLNRLDWDG